MKAFGDFAIIFILAALAGVILSCLDVASALSWFAPPKLRTPSFLKELSVLAETSDNKAATARPLPKAEFRQWCDSVGLRAPNLEHTNRTVDGVPGVTVLGTSSLRAGECAIVLPVHAAIVVLADPPPDVSEEEGWNAKSPIPHILCDDAWADAPQRLRLVCLLLSERQKGASSHYHGYIDHLPPVSGPGRERCDTLDRWTAAELDLLKLPDFANMAADIAKLNTEWFDTLEKQQPHPSADGGRTDIDSPSRSVITRMEFDWALDIVKTRAFAGDFAVPKRGGGHNGDYALLPFIDDLNHRETTRKKRRTGNSSGSPSTTPPAVFEFPPVGSVLGRTTDAICWVAHLAHGPGDEVAHSYLHGSEAIAEDFLCEWGFSPSSEDVDANLVYMMGVRVVVRGDGRIDDEVCVVNAIREKLVTLRKDGDIPMNGEKNNCGDESSTGEIIVTDADVWRCIAMCCDKEAAYFEADNGESTSKADATTRTDEDDDISPRRRAIARAFLDGKKRILRAGSERALLQAAD